jgi:hypothetical protein
MPFVGIRIFLVPGLRDAFGQSAKAAWKGIEVKSLGFCLCEDILASSHGHKEGQDRV